MNTRVRYLGLIVCFLGVLAWFYWQPFGNGHDSKADSAEEAYYRAADVRTLEPVKLSAEDEQLMERIRQMAEAERIAPIDAKVDPVWKAIPGYNGRELDIEQTFKLSRGQPRIHPVYREVPPRVQLEDLGAHPIYKGNPQKPMVSLMINVAWGNEYLPGMLKTLRENNVKATFFLDGSWLSKFPEEARAILADGHEIGNHGYSHKDMSKLSRDAAYEEINRTTKLIKETLGVDVTLFAPPSGDYDEETVDLAHELKLKTILWTLDTVDWKKPAPSWIIQRIATRLEPGALILMHPTDSSSRALPELIRSIKSQGLTPGTVSELLSPSRVDKVESILRF